MLYIVLPPELSRKAMATLIQYMYTGEGKFNRIFRLLKLNVNISATVANEILNEVLKGGEVLKIRGLCKVNTGNSEIFNSKPIVDQPAIPSYQSYKLIENGSSATTSPLKSNKSTPRNSIDKKTVHSEARSTSAISHHHVLTQQEPPVVVLTSQTNTPHSYAQQQSMNSNNQQQLPQSTTIIVKKDMAIDPGESNIPVEHYGLISLKIAAAVKKAQQQCVVPSMKRSPSITSGPSSSDQRRDFYQIEDNLKYDDMTSPTSFKVYTSASDESLQQQQLQDDILEYTEKKKRMVENQKPSSSSIVRESTKGNRFMHSENGQHFTSSVHHTADREKLPQFPEALSFLTIKEEPFDWTEIEGNGITSQTADIRTEIITVKPENMDEIETSLGSEMIEKTYSPLTCEVCNLKFQVPQLWVRHIESHSELSSAQQNVSKKRRRADEVSGDGYQDEISRSLLETFRSQQEENTENINILSCDLCENIHFATPADWVRHVQNTHTETELAMSNNSILMKK